jgi:hypothetical protein
MNWFADLSHNNNLQKWQAAEMIENGCIGFGIKLCQGNYSIDAMVESNVALANEFNAPYFFYHWVDPIYDSRSQVDYALKAMDKYNPTGLAVDIEQFWKSWKEWYAVYVYKTSSYIQKYSPEYLYQHYRDYLKLIKPQLDIPLIGYTGPWFVNTYCRAIATAIKEYCDGTWIAAYREWFQVDADPNVTWQEFHLTLEKLTSPTMPMGISTWDLWQCGVLPMRGYSKLDINITKPSDVVSKLFSKTPVIPPEPEPLEPSTLQMEVVADTLNIRSSPKVLTTNDIGDLSKETKLNVLNIAGTDAWIEFEPGKYACVQKGTDRYMKVVI